jgi:hypothetical protein
VLKAGIIVRELLIKVLNIRAFFGHGTLHNPRRPGNISILSPFVLIVYRGYIRFQVLS